MRSGPPRASVSAFSRLPSTLSPSQVLAKKSSDSKYEVTRSSLQLRLKENQSYDILQPMKISFGNSDAFWKDREREDPDALLPKCEEKIHNWCVWWQRGYVIRLEMFRRFEDEMSLDKNIIYLYIYIYVMYMYMYIYYYSYYYAHVL